MKKITIAFPYYENPEMLKYQLRHLSAMPANLRENLELIVVDDGSSQHPLTEVPRLNFSCRMFRTKVHVDWNISFSRNLAAEKASGEWLLMTDIDHVIPFETLEHIMSKPMDNQSVYTFSRFKAGGIEPLSPGEPRNPHLNTFFLTKKMFWELGGEDERLVSYYGAQEWDFQNRTRSRQILLKQYMIVVNFELIYDAKCHNVPRKETDGHAEKRKLGLDIILLRDRGALPFLRLTYAYDELTTPTRQYARPDNTAVCTILAYPGDENIPTTFGFMQASCKRLGIHLHWFLAGQKFLFKVKEIDMSFENKIKRFWDEVNALDEKYKYILFVDARDILFVRPLQVVCDGYNRIGWPILMSATRKCAHHVDPSWLARFGSHRSGFNFLNSGMWMAERKALGEAIEHLKRHSEAVKEDKVFCSFPPLWNNDQHLWQTAYVERSVPIKLDHDQEVFNNFHQLDISEYDFDKSNCETPVVLKNGSKPAIIHFAGQATVAMPFVAWTLNIVRPGVIPSKLPT